MRGTVADERGAHVVAITDPPFATSLFSGTRWAWLWLIFRLYVGYNWIEASLGKLSSPDWMQTGVALKGFWTNALTQGAGTAHPAIAFGWYRAFIQALSDSGSYVWFAKVIAVGEFVVGAALILGLFTGIAAFFGGFLNWNFMMAGSASINPVLFILSIFLVLAWKVAGWWGLDRWLLHSLGTPWRPGQIFGSTSGPAANTTIPPNRS
jgi:thiosulfate dehydrogenase (quinone) large subunit